jgi:Phage portal protein/zinc-ribbon domain
VTRLVDRLIRRSGYWEGDASGAAVLTTSYGSPDREAILPSLTAWSKGAYSGNSVVFSAILTRLLLFSEATFQFQALDDKHLFGNQSLGILETPWPGGSTGELLVRMEQDVSLAGNSFTWAPPDLDMLVRLRPDWTTIVSELVQVDGGGQYRRKLGYWVEPPRTAGSQGGGQFYPADEVAHWAPLPDPAADFRGMSWLTPVYRDIQGDDGLTQYKIRYLENSASPNLLIRYAQKLHAGSVDAIRERVTARHGGVSNAFKTLVLDQGADVTVIGNSLAQMDFSNVGAAGAERILSAGAVPGVLVGIEPLRGAGKGYQESMTKFANLWARPQWRSACSALEQLVSGMPSGNRLWYDTSDIAALQDGELEKGQAALVRGQTLLALAQARYTPDSSVAFVNSGDVTKLVALPAAPPPPAGNVQHMLSQTSPGVTAIALPSSAASLPVGSTSPGDGGNGTRPAPVPTAARRSAQEPGEGEQECPSCGAVVDEDDLFCPQCGAQMPDGDDDDPDDPDTGDDATRFSVTENRVTSGTGGGQWTKGGANPSSAKPAPTKTAHGGTTAPVQGGGGGAGSATKAQEKQHLLEQAKADREKAAELTKELHVLEHQRGQEHKAHAAAVKSAASAKASKRKPAKARKAARHKKRAASLDSRITTLKGRISHLTEQAHQLDAKAAAL